MFIAAVSIITPKSATKNNKNSTIDTDNNLNEYKAC